MLGLMKSWSSSSCNWFDIYCNSDGARWYGARKIGAAILAMHKKVFFIREWNTNGSVTTRDFWVHHPILTTMLMLSTKMCIRSMSIVWFDGSSILLSKVCLISINFSTVNSTVYLASRIVVVNQVILLRFLGMDPYWSQRQTRRKHNIRRGKRTSNDLRVLPCLSRPDHKGSGFGIIMFVGVYGYKVRVGDGSYTPGIGVSFLFIILGSYELGWVEFGSS